MSTPYKFPSRFRKPYDLIKQGKNARTNVKAEAVVFREPKGKPLVLRNHVNKVFAKRNEKVCMDQMIIMMDCLTKYNQDQSLCGKEIERFV